jgi:hypothetical protein
MTANREAVLIGQPHRAVYVPSRAGSTCSQRLTVGPRLPLKPVGFLHCRLAEHELDELHEIGH